MHKEVGLNTILVEIKDFEITSTKGNLGTTNLTRENGGQTKILGLVPSAAK